MQQIFEATENVGKLTRTQKKKPDTEYRMSKHFMAVECPEGTLYFHTLTGEMVLLRTGEPVDPDELIAHWFMVPQAFDENRYTDQIREVLLLVNRRTSAKTSFTIFTTTDCNARCFYCYEMGRSRIPMTAETAHAVAAYIAKVCDGQEVRLNWFGGEPLYNQTVIDVITTDLRQNGVTFSSSMVSNGYYLDEKTVRRAVDDWKLKKIQITLDGTRDVYNRTKAFIDADENPFERVLRHIGLALDAGIRINVRLNMDARNAEDLSNLVDLLAERFGGREKFSVYAAQIQDFHGSRRSFGSEQEAIARMTALQDKIARLGLTRPEKAFSRKMTLSSCMADNDAAEVLLPDGRTGKCEHFSETEITGSIFDDARDEQLLSDWKQHIVHPECADCALYPRCVQLQKCDWAKLGCSESARTMKLQQLQHQILTAYEQSKAPAAE